MVFDHAGEPAVRIVMAYSAGNASGLGEGVVQFEADDGIDALRAGMGTAPVPGDPKGIRTVEVVAVDDDEGLVDLFGGHQYGMRRSPGLLPFGVHSKS